MNEQDFTYLAAPTYPLRQLTTLPFEVEEAKEIMRKHGCTLEEHPKPKFTPVPCKNATGLYSLMDMSCARRMIDTEKLAY